MDVFKLLRQDHRTMDDLLQRLTQPADRADFDRTGRGYLVDRLVQVASRHDAAEEMTFWPHVRRRLGNGDSLADRALVAERDIRSSLELLRVTRSTDEIITSGERLRELFSEHVSFEESEVFPAMRRCTTPVWRALAAWRFRLAGRAAPTRPHPDGPVTPAGFMTVGVPTIVLDHLRDRFSATRHHPERFDDGHPDAVAVVEADHAKIRRAFALIDAHDEPDDELVNDAIRLLAIHDSIERQYLYPEVRRRLEDGNQVYACLIAEHGDLASQAANIDAYRFHDAARTAWLRELAASCRGHMEREEAEVLPALRRHLTGDELIGLGRQMAAGRDKAPTRPHPHAAGAGAGARLSRRFVAPLDRAREALTRRS